LQARGIENLPIVKASGTVSAAGLQLSNRKGNFLAGAEVAFVLK
jgi:hypothetical protein